MPRAYSLLTIKAIDDDERVIEGIATTPSPDRVGDIVEPDGAEFQLPLPLLWQHDSWQPIGHVEKATITKDGIAIRARFVKIAEPGALQERLDEAWQSVKSGLVRGLSIGFKSLESSRIEDTWSERFIKWLWLELSCVTIPANQDASITSVKAIDQTLLAASGTRQRPVVRLGPTSPGDSGIPKQKTKGPDMRTIKETIAAFEAKRAASAARMKEIMDKANEEMRSLLEAELQEYETLKAELKSVDEHIVRLKDHEVTMVAAATPISPAAGASPGAASQTRSGSIISVKSNALPGTAFTRYVIALGRTKGNLSDALAVAANNVMWKDSTPEVETVLKAAVAAGTTTDPTWASPLVAYQTMASEFIALLRPATILGKIVGLRRVPFNVRMASQTSGSSVAWVGEGAPKPVSKLGFNEVTLRWAKAAGIVVMTEELIRNSSPSAELVVRTDLTDAIAQFLDEQFINPNIGEVANVSPGSITAGVTPTPVTGTNAAAVNTDVQALFQTYILNNLNPATAFWIMSPTTALALSLMLNALGQKVFPDITLAGGMFFGLPVIVSTSATVAGSPTIGNMIILANAAEILLADDEQVVIDASREASLQMLDNPTNTPVGGTVATTMVSMFQTNSVAIRAERWINWKKRRSQAVAFLQNVAYAA